MFLLNASIPLCGSLGGPNPMVPKRSSIELIGQNEVTFTQEQINKYLVEYEQNRAENDNMKSLDFVEGGDPIKAKNLIRAVNRMSYDYQKKERKMAKLQQTKNKIESNLS